MYYLQYPGEVKKSPQADRQSVLVFRVINLVLRHLIGHRRLGLDDGFVELGRHNLGVGSHFPHAREGESFHAAPQGAEVGAEQLRHHVNAPVCQVDSGRAVSLSLIHI